jgi:hypothetical protein
VIEKKTERELTGTGIADRTGSRKVSEVDVPFTPSDAAARNPRTEANRKNPSRATPHTTQ